MHRVAEGASGDESTWLRVLSIQGFWTKSKARTCDRKDSINTRVRQFSTRDLKDMIIPPVVFELNPKGWKLPKKPKKFRKILDAVGR